MFNVTIIDTSVILFGVTSCECVVWFVSTAYGFLAICLTSCLVGEINVDVADVEHQEGRSVRLWGFMGVSGVGRCLGMLCGASKVIRV